MPNGQELHLVEKKDGVFIEYVIDEKNALPPEVHFALQVNMRHWNAIKNAIKKYGYNTVETANKNDSELYQAYVQDPSGNVIEIIAIDEEYSMKYLSPEQITEANNEFTLTDCLPL